MDNLKHIANISVQRLSKAKCYAELRQVIEGVDMAALDGKTQTSLAKLYQHFMPAPTAKPKSYQEWVARAAAGGRDVREYLHYIYAHDGKLVATDGHRLHLVHGATYPDGFYDLAMVEHEIGFRYPDYKRVIPSGEGLRHSQFWLESLDKWELEPNPNEPKITLIRVNGTDIWINQRYLKDAVSFFSPSEPVELVTKNKESAIMLKQGDYSAVIMPVRV